ncbi:MAG: ABC transporter substrate-binding protein [Anaerolineae bacterium]
MKGLMKLLTLCLLVSFVAGCAVQAPQVPSATEAPKPADTVAPEPTLTEAEAWLKANELGPYAPAQQDWAAIEAAAKEEGKVVVYANSSRIEKAAALWQEKYPDIVVEGFDLGGDEAVVKVREEQKAGAYVGDVYFAGGGADVFGELYPKGYLVPFVPDDLLSVIPEEARNPFVVSRYGVRVLGYNFELNPDGCPITNWWQLTEPEWKGRVYIEDPLTDASTMGILTTIASHADELAAAYKELYGSDPVLDEDTPDAGWLWVKKFAQNSPIPEPGGDEVVQAFASPGMTEAGVGFTSYSKYRDTVKGELVFDACKGVKPVMGVQTQAYLAIINQAPHPNAAKLFINFILNEGFEPWNVIGDYAARTDVPAPEGAIPRQELNVWSQDSLFVYQNISKMRDFWTINFLQ